MLAVDALMRKYPQQGTALLLEGGVFKSVLNICGEVVRDGKDRQSDGEKRRAERACLRDNANAIPQPFLRS